MEDSDSISSSVPGLDAVLGGGQGGRWFWFSRTRNMEDHRVWQSRQLSIFWAVSFTLWQFALEETITFISSRRSKIRGLPELSSAKTLGGVGVILTLFTLVPDVGFLITIVGWVMVLVAIKYIADIVGNKSIYNNAITAVILAIIGAVLLALIVLGAIFQFVGLNGLNFGTTSTTAPPPSDVVGLIVGVLAGLALLWVFGIVSAVFLRMSFNKIAAALNLDLFKTGAVIYLIGAALTIILVGFVLILVAQIMFIIAFFSIPDKLPTSTMTEPQITGPPPPAPPTTPPSRTS